MDDWHEGVVLLDVPPGAEGEFDREMLERMGHPVLVMAPRRRPRARF